MRFRAAVVLGLLLLVFARESAGQTFQGGIRGAVRDPNGVVPGAEVTITNQATSIKRSVTSNESGEYVFAAVDPGTYTVHVGLQGFKSVDRKDVRVGTAQNLVIDLMLEVGAIEESVTVTGASPLIETANASQGTVLDSATLQTLPAPGRNAFMIGVSVPTVIPSGDAQFNRQQDQTNASLLSLGGGARRANNYTLDGVPITDIRNRASANPTIEALDDVKVQVHTYDAEMGRTGGGVFNTTLKSGTNSYKGTVFFQTRPVWAQKNNYFADIAGIPKPEPVYYLFGGGVGGPIKQNRTFFWFSSEDYHNVSTRNIGVTFPTAAERSGDFSGLTTPGGLPIIIYDPLTRQPFANNRIPANRINPVAANMLKYLPLPDINRDNGTINYNRTATINDKFQQEYTVKVEHKFTDKVSLSGFYLYNRTDEPCADYFEVGQNGANRFADPNNYVLVRRPQIVALNNTWITGDSSVLALRFGWTRFPDNNTLTADFDPTTLGFAQTYANEITLKKFPYVDIADYNQQGRTFGAINPTQINYKSWGTNGSYSRFIGTHTIKVGADYRRIAMDSYIPGNGAGIFTFDREFTSATGLTANDPLSGNAFASFLLGYPSGNSGNLAQLTTTTPLNVFTNYYGGYVQDDYRVSSKFTVNYGLRIEHEDGLREQNNAFTIGFDPKRTSALSGITIPASVDPTGQMQARQVTGGLLYAGVDGSKTYQGNPPKAKFSPRVGAVYSINTNTVVRGGYGMYWAPWNYPAPSTAASNYGQVGYTNNTLSPQTPATPSVTLTNPFPNGVAQPLGNSLGALSGLGQNISFVDQNRTAPRVQQWSVDLQRELPGSMAITVSYVGARGDHLGLGGSADTAVNLNQIDPKYLALGTALNDRLPNPFFGIAAAGPLSTSATLSRAQLLRPYPQFNQVNARQVTEGLSRYNAGVIEWSKRMTHGWGGRVSYTRSVLKDNQIGETNFYSRTGTANDTGLPMNNYTFIPGSLYYDPRAEYSFGILDVPHRVIIAPIVELPFGVGKKWATSGLADLLAGGWSVSAIVNLQSGFPISVSQSDNTSGALSGYMQRPNLVPGVDPNTPGGYADRLASADHPSATWVNPAAFSLAPAYTFGNAPRTLSSVRTPQQKNTDMSIMKNFKLGGSRVGQVKLEVLNVFNRVTMRGNSTSNNRSSATFEQWNQQSGFQRMLQVMFRYQF